MHLFANCWNVQLHTFICSSSTQIVSGIDQGSTESISVLFPHCWLIKMDTLQWAQLIYQAVAVFCWRPCPSLHIPPHSPHLWTRCVLPLLLSESFNGTSWDLQSSCTVLFRHWQNSILLDNLSAMLLSCISWKYLLICLILFSGLVYCFIGPFVAPINEEMTHISLQMDDRGQSHHTCHFWKRRETVRNRGWCEPNQEICRVTWLCLKDQFWPDLDIWEWLHCSMLEHSLYFILRTQ